MSASPRELILLTQSNPKALTDWAELMMRQEFPLKGVGISKLGLHNPLQVVAFLKTPAGIKYQNNIVNEFILYRQQLEQLSTQILASQQLRDRVLGLLFLESLAASQAYADQVKQETIAQQQTETTASSTTEHTGHITSIPGVAKEISDAMMDCTKLIVNLAVVEQQAEELTEKLADLHKKSQKAEVKYDSYMNAFEKIDELFRDLKNKAETAAVSIEVLVAKELKKIEDDIEELTSKIESFILDDQDEEAFKLMLQVNSLWLQHSALHDSNITQTTEPFKLGDMEFLIDSKSEKVVEKDGKFYLLKTHDDLDEMLEKDPTAAELAHQKFESIKHNIMPVKTQVVYNRKVEQKHYKDNLAIIDENRAANIEQNQKLQQDIAEKKSTIATLELKMKPQPAPKEPLLEFSPTPQQKKELKDFHNFAMNNPNMTIIQYSRQIKSYQPAVQNVLNRQLELQIDNRPTVGRSAENTFNPTSSIPTQKMKRLLELMPTLSLDQAKPHITPKPPQVGANQEHKPEPTTEQPGVESDEPENKSSFNPRPDPFKINK